MRLTDFSHFRDFLATDFHGVWTSGPKRTARRRICGIGDVTLQDRSLRGGFGIRNWNGRQQRLGIRMTRLAVNRLTGRNFYNFSQVHDRHSIGYVLDNGQIMGNEQIRQVEFVL